MQGIAAAALTASYQDCVEVLLPLVEHLTRDDEPEIRHVAVQQLRGLGELSCPLRPASYVRSSMLMIPWMDGCRCCTPQQGC